MAKLSGLFLILFFQFASAQSHNSSDHSNPSSFEVSGSPDWLPLYNGRLFYSYPFITTGNAFYPDNEWHTGEIVYDGITYSSIPILYDAYKDVVLVKHPVNLTIILFSKRVKEFSFGDNYFFYKNEGERDNMKKGFYQLILTGKVTLLSKRIKFYQETINGMELQREFLVKDEYYILKNGSYYQISNQKNFFQLLKEKRRELMSKRKQLKLRFKRDPENFIKILTSYYNQLFS